MNTEQETGRIVEVRKNSFLIGFGEREVLARLKGSFHAETSDKLPVVGDYVLFLCNPGGDSVIQSVCERKSLLGRPDQAKTGVMQYMVANADYCFIVTALDKDYSYNRIARYAGIALQGGVIPVAVLTKADLCGDVETAVRETQTISDKLRVHAVSALNGTGLDELKPYFAPGKTVCLMGSSGAGKSTLINALAGEEIMKTAAVRQSDSKGRHTTTHRQLIRLKNGAFVIDTPGMREIGMARSEEGIDETFSDILALEEKCRFRNCRHETEPGCAVKTALADGTLSEERWLLYKSLQEENTKNYAKMKEISKKLKILKKEKERTSGK